MKVSAISFDADMTLWDLDKVMRHALEHTLTELRRQIPTQRALSLTVDEMIGIRNRLAQDLKGKVWALEEIRRLAFERTLELIGCPDRGLADRLNRIYLKHRFGDIELYDDVVPALDVLAPHFNLGLVSNGNSYPERCGLGGRFGFVVFAQDVRIEKPDRRIFQIAAERARCPLEQLVHVGDSLEDDVAGAGEAGAQTVWLNRQGLKNDTGVRADFEVTSLTELPAIFGIGGS